MACFYFSKIIRYLIFTIIMQIVLFSFTYAGRLITIDGVTAYHTDEGVIAKNTWVWIDDNGDSIAECYRFNELGILATNYTHYDGKTTNDKGQLIENGRVIRKMISTGKIITSEAIEYGPKENDTNDYLYGNVLISKSINKKIRQKIDDGLHLGSETLSNDESIDGQVIDKVTGVYKPLSDVVPESGIIYSKGDHDDVTIGKDGKIIPGRNAINFISSSNKFDKEVKDVVVFNGDIWDSCMALKGNNSRVKFLLNKYNYMYFEISNENHTNECDRKELDAILSIYADDILMEEIEDFTDSDPQVIELELDGKKTLEFKLTIKSGDILERVYINNARFRKIKNED